MGWKLGHDQPAGGCLSSLVGPLRELLGENKAGRGWAQLKEVETSSVGPRCPSLDTGRQRIFSWLLLFMECRPIPKKAGWDGSPKATQWCSPLTPAGCSQEWETHPSSIPLTRTKDLQEGDGTENPQLAALSRLIPATCSGECT